MVNRVWWQYSRTTGAQHHKTTAPDTTRGFTSSQLTSAGGCRPNHWISVHLNKGWIRWTQPWGLLDVHQFNTTETPWKGAWGSAGISEKLLSVDAWELECSITQAREHLVWRKETSISQKDHKRCGTIKMRHLV